MLHLLSGLYNDWTHVEPYRAVLLGQTGHGKSGLVGSLSHAVAGKPRVPIASLRPTLGQSVIELPLPLPLPPVLAAQVQAAAASHDDHGGWFQPQTKRRRPSQLKLWDLGASADLAKLWPRYYDETDCIVFAVDAGAFSWMTRSASPPLSPQSTTPPPAESSFAANQAWNQLASILSHPSLREKPVLIAVTKVDLLPLGVQGVAPTTVDSGMHWEPTAPGSPLDQFEERVRAWLAERFVQVGSSAQQSQIGSRELGTSTTTPTPPIAPPEQHPTQQPTEAKPDAPNLPLAPAGPGEVKSAEEPETPPSDPLQAATSSAEAAASRASNARESPKHKEAPPMVEPAIPAEPQLRPDDDSDTPFDPQAIAERYWEVVAVSAVSLVGLADLACCLQMLAQQAN